MLNILNNFFGFQNFKVTQDFDQLIMILLTMDNNQFLFPIVDKFLLYPFQYYLEQTILSFFFFIEGLILNQSILVHEARTCPPHKQNYSN